MTLEEIAEARRWFDVNARHLVDYESRMLRDTAERALILLADVAEGKTIRDPPAQHVATVQRCRAALEPRIARQPPPQLTPQAFDDGRMLPLSAQRALGVYVTPRSFGPRVMKTWSVRDLPSRVRL